MGSRFARHGTTGYRWPKVCETPKPPPQPTAQPMIAPQLFATVLINDPSFPANNLNVTDFPVPWVGSGATYQKFPGPSPSTSIQITLTTGSNTGLAQLFFGLQKYDTGSIMLQYFLGQVYAAGPYDLFNPMHIVRGSISLHS